MTIALLVAGACSKAPAPSKDDAAQEEARQRDCPDLKTWAECQARTAARAQATAAGSAEAAEHSRLQGRAKTIASSAAMPSETRDAWVRQCVQKLGCKQWQVDAIIEGAPPSDQPRLTRISMAAAAEDLAKAASDGTQLSVAQAGPIAGLLARADVGLAALDLMSPTSLAEAKKDPAGARGKVLRVSGRIIEIRKTGDLFEGALATDNGSIVRFATMLSTAKLFEDSYATFRGVFVQEYDYPNVSGGQTRSLYLVGGFDIPENRSPH